MKFPTAPPRRRPRAIESGRFRPVRSWTRTMTAITATLETAKRIARSWKSPKRAPLFWTNVIRNQSPAISTGFPGVTAPRTNAFLKKIGRHVARKSQHMVGHAIDLYFPDVPTIKIRNSALVRQVGGVGYYTSGAGPTGFVHIDSGNVRHWGPAISQVQMAMIMRDYRKTVGARLNKKGMKAVPEVEVAEVEDPAVERDGERRQRDQRGQHRAPQTSGLQHQADDDAGENLDAFLVAFLNSGVNIDRITDFENQRVLAQVFRFNLLN